MFRHFIIGKALLVVAVALVLAAPAAADPWGRDEYLAQQRSAPSGERPDDRAGVRGVGPLPVVQVKAASASSFEWGDAAIGGAAAIGAVVLGSGLVLIAYRRRSRFAL